MFHLRICHYFSLYYLEYYATVFISSVIKPNKTEHFHVLFTQYCDNTHIIGIVYSMEWSVVVEYWGGMLEWDLEWSLGVKFGVESWSGVMECVLYWRRSSFIVELTIFESGSYLKHLVSMIYLLTPYWTKEFYVCNES